VHDQDRARDHRVAVRQPTTRRHAERPVSRLNSRACTTPTDASRPPSRTADARLGPSWVASPSMWRTFPSFPVRACRGSAAESRLRRCHGVPSALLPCGPASLRTDNPLRARQVRASVERRARWNSSTDGSPPSSSRKASICRGPLKEAIDGQSAIDRPVGGRDRIHIG
jgi:hypothetical protein